MGARRRKERDAERRRISSEIDATVAAASSELGPGYFQDEYGNFYDTFGRPVATPAGRMTGGSDITNRGAG